MINQKRYPRLEIDTEKFRTNAHEVISRCEKIGISVAGVIKGYNGFPELTRILKDEGAAQIASARLEQIKCSKEAGIQGPFMLLRIPMMTELEELVDLCDYSLQSEIEILDMLNAECRRQGKKHKVIIMHDSGDLREGFWGTEETVNACVYVENQLDMVELAGIGENFGCYGAIKPTAEKMNELTAIAGLVENAIGRKLEIVSGGATTTYSLVHWGTMPKGINHLRIGENICLSDDLRVNWGLTGLEYLNPDVFTLKAEIIELKDKPSYPVGSIFTDAFGNKPTFEDRGVRKRAIVGIGKLDVGDIEKLRPKEKGIFVLGGSSDHTILDVQDSERKLHVGDIIEFDVNYTAMLFLTASVSVEKEFI